MNQDDVINALRNGPKTVPEIQEFLEPGLTGVARTTCRRSIQYKLRVLSKWGSVHEIGTYNDGCSHFKVWALTSKEVGE